MSITQQIDRIRGNIGSAYNALENAGAEMPGIRNSANLGSTADSLPLIGGKMDRMTEVRSAEERQLLNNGQLFKQQSDIGVTDASAQDGYTLLAKKAELSALATRSELAALAQSGTPVFVRQISECVDASKLYVLPDGFIYAYTTVSREVPDYTDLVPGSTVSGGGSVYNGTGYKDGAYVSGSSDGSDAAYTATGYISYQVPQTGLPPEIYVKGSQWKSTSHTRLSFFDSTYSFINTVSVSGGSGFNGMLDLTVLGEDFFKLSPVASGSTSKLYEAAQDICYIRLSVEGVGADLTVATSPIVNRSEMVTTWANTGISFVPSDNESRIIALENGSTATEARVTAIENTLASDDEAPTPSYVTAEAERASRAVLSHQGPDTVTFAAVSDAHYSSASADIVNAVTHAGEGLKELKKRIHLDFALLLGDNGWQSQTDSLDEGIEQILAANRLLSEGLGGIPNFRTPGNHCSQIGAFYTNLDYHRNSDLYPLYGAYNTGAVFDGNNRRRGYCFRDFEDKKLRVICLNTSDLEDEDPSDLTTHNISAEQLAWLINALDVSAQADAAGWQILVLGHAPLDWCERTMPAAQIISAYASGGSGTAVKDGVSLAYDFSAVTRGRIIAQIHGHTHDYKIDSLHIPNGQGGTVQTSVKRIAVPNACFSRNNQYNNGSYEYLDIEFGDDVTYPKTAGTAQDTAFSIFTVDLKSHTIYVDRYGAGIDRETSY